MDLNEPRDDEILGFSGISWTVCKQSDIITPTPHHSVFTDQMLFLMPNQQCLSTDGTSYHCPKSLESLSIMSGVMLSIHYASTISQLVV